MRADFARCLSRGCQRRKQCARFMPDPESAPDNQVFVQPDVLGERCDLFIPVTADLPEPRPRHRRRA